MSDNTTLNPGTGGDVVASKDVSGVKHSRALNETLNAAGTPVDVSPSNPMPATVDTGTLMQRIEVLEMFINQLLHGAGGQTADPAGRTRVSIDAGTLPLVTQVGTVTSISNPVTLAGQVPNLAALMLRNRIVVS